MKISADLSTILGIVMAVAFLVNIIVQLTKGFIPVPTKLWCIIVSIVVMMAVLYAGISFCLIEPCSASIIFGIFGSFIVAFIAMYGFDTFKELWERFMKGEDINE